MNKSSFHLGDCLYGILGLKILQLFWSETFQPLSIWDMLLMAAVIIILWARQVSTDGQETC